MSAPRTPVKPRDIDHRRPLRSLVDAVYDFDSAHAAGAIIDFCQAREGNSWEPIKLADLEPFYIERERAAGKRTTSSLPLFIFEKLVKNKFITIKSGVVTLTVQFVARCYGAAPKE